MTAGRKRLGRRETKGDPRGARLSERAQVDIKRVMGLWELNPDFTAVRLAYFTGIRLSSITGWSQRGLIRRPAKKDPPPAATPSTTATAAPRPAPSERPVTDDWDEGEVPTVESLRREIKRKIRQSLNDSLMVQQYSSALDRLQGIKEDEGKEELESRDVITVYLPSEDRRPDPDA